MHLKSGVLPIIAGRLLSHEGPDCGDGGAVSGGELILMGCEERLRRNSLKQHRGLWARYHYFGGLDS